MGDFLTALRSGRVLLMDGAMGTELQRAGMAREGGYEPCNLTHPETVRAIHRAYAQAGAEVLLTNTFQAHAGTLGSDEDRMIAIIEAGVAHARSAFGGAGWALASIGPAAGFDHETCARLLAACRNADGVLLETFSDVQHLTAVAGAARAGLGSSTPLMVSFTFDGKTLKTFADVSPEDCAKAAVELDAAALGVNCGRELGLAASAEILRRYRTISSIPLFARPNAGTPTAGLNYPRDPEEMAAGLTGLLEAGAVMIGGCCGTTPEHIRAYHKVVDGWNARLRR
jgi:5-methyltetrahydrofolate--homocysteine methyltransferase